MVSVESVKHWIALAAQLKTVKKQEMDLRKEISADILGVNICGTKHMAFGEVEVSCSRGEKIAITREDIMVHQEDLSEAEKACIVWKPSLDKTAYDLLPKDSILRKIAKLTLGAPSVKAVNLEV